MRIAILISGRGSNMAALSKKEEGFEICLVASDRPADGLEIASLAGHNIALVDRDIYQSKQEHEAKLAEQLMRQKPDLIVLAGYMSVLSATFIKKFNAHIINIHPSLLPDYKGLNTHQRALDKKEKYSGCSVHFVTSKLDSGKIILQKQVKISKKDTSKTLAKKILKQEHKLYPKALLKVFSL